MGWLHGLGTVANYATGGALGDFGVSDYDSTGKLIRKSTDALGLTSPPPPDLTKTPAAEALSKFSGQLVDEYTNRTPGSTPNISAGQVAAPTLDQTQANQARASQAAAIADLQRTANGGPTAADALLQKGTDQAVRNASGLAAQYSGQNPGAALRAGLSAGTDATNQAASTMAAQKATEEAAAQNNLANAATSMRTGDTSIAATNATNSLDTQKANAANSLTADQANQQTNLNQQQVNNTDAQNRRSAAETGLVAPMAAAQAQAQLNAQNNAANQTVVGNLVSTAAKISDARLKTDIRDGSQEADQFLASLAPRDYAWKDPADPRTTGPGKHLGVIAQEMRPKDTGALPDGTKYIAPDVFSKMLAGLGRVNQRLDAVEGKKPRGPADVDWSK